MALQSGVVDLRDLGLALEVGREFDGVGLGLVDPQRHGLQTAEREPAVEGREARAFRVLREVEPLREGVVVDDILKQARQSQETASSNGQSEEIAQLRRQVELQQQALGALLEGRGDASAYYQAAAAPPPRSPSDSAVDVRRNSVPATTGRFSFTQPAQPPPRDTMSEPATDGLA